jgi:hypothetical protein
VQSIAPIEELIMNEMSEVVEIRYEGLKGYVQKLGLAEGFTVHDVMGYVDEETEQSAAEPAVMRQVLTEMVDGGMLTVLDVGEGGESRWAVKEVQVMKASDVMSEEEKDEAGKVLRQLSALKQSVGEKFYLMGGLLRQVSLKEYWKKEGFKSFAEYVETVLDLKIRMAEYLIQINEYYGDMALKFPDVGVIPKISQLGVTKAIQLVGVADGGSIGDWVKRAQGLSVRELKEAVAKEKGGEIPKAAKGSSTASIGEVFTRMTFQLAEAQLKNVNAALEVLREEAGSDKTGHLLDCMATLVLSHYSDDSPFAIVLEKLERATGGKCVFFEAGGACQYGQETLERLAEQLRAESDTGEDETPDDDDAPE